MFSIFRADLKLKHPAVDQLIQKNMNNAVDTLDDARVCKYIWLIENFDRLRYPISVLKGGREIFNIHPGVCKTIIAKLLDKDYMDALIIDTNVEYDVLHDLSINARKPDKLIVSNMHNSPYWEILVPEDGFPVVNYDKMWKSYVEEKYGIGIQWVLNGEILYTYNKKNPDKDVIHIKSKDEFWQSLLEFTCST